MRLICLITVILATSSPAFAQSDLNLLLFPERNYSKTIMRSEISQHEKVNDEEQSEEVEMKESRFALRYNLKHTEARDLYFTTDAYWVSTHTDATFKESGAEVPGDLYDTSIGMLYRAELDNGWTFGGSGRIGSSSDKLFNSSDETYFRSLAFLRVPHLEYTSWVFMASVNTDGDFPIYPGLAYAFPISRTAYAMIGIPIIAAGGQITEKLGVSAMFLPYNSNVRFDYALNDRVTPYAGFISQSRYFSRADREEDDDRLRLSDSRIFAGTTIGVFEHGTIDLRAGYVFDREFGEGDDRDERNDNSVEIDDAAFFIAGFEIKL
jgi:hypothetical protein